MGNFPESQPMPIQMVDMYGPRLQWIFPDFSFNCNGSLTKWIFKGVGDRDARCRVELTTWRLFSNTSTTTVYIRESTTDRNTARVTVEDDGSTFTYELATPVRVQPGDFVGAESMCLFFREPASTLYVQGLYDNENGSVSYRQSERGSFFYVGSTVLAESNFLPLIQVVIGMLGIISDIDSYYY